MDFQQRVFLYNQIIKIQENVLDAEAYHLLFKHYREQGDLTNLNKIRYQYLDYFLLGKGIFNNRFKRIMERVDQG